MIFIYLLIVGCIGVAITLGIEYKRSQQPILQIIKNWCNIRNVNFEPWFQKIHKRYKPVSQHLQKKVRKHTSDSLGHITKHGKNIKYVIRKKLHPEQSTETTSDFITKIKN